MLSYALAKILVEEKKKKKNYHKFSPDLIVLTPSLSI